MNVVEIQKQIDKLQALLNQKLALEKKPSDDKFLELIVGNRPGCNLDPDTSLLLKTYDDKGNMVVYIPVVVNNFSTPGKPFQKKRYFRGKLVTSSLGVPITDTVIPQIVGRTQIQSSTLPFRDLTLTGFASLQISSLTPEEVEEETSSSSHLRVSHNVEVVRAHRDEKKVETSAILPATTYAVDDTDDISTTGDL